VHVTADISKKVHKSRSKLLQKLIYIIANAIRTDTHNSTGLDKNTIENICKSQDILSEHKYVI